jgi:K+/H+ antiporter YhaU regulatory subunit KhtT
LSYILVQREGQVKAVEYDRYDYDNEVMQDEKRWFIPDVMFEREEAEEIARIINGMTHVSPLFFDVARRLIIAARTGW